jgi:DNA-binding MarR family transcriptional regulator
VSSLGRRLRLHPSTLPSYIGWLYTCRMTSQPTDILENLLTSTHRLTRIAAQETGRTTSPAVWRTLSILTTDGSMRVGDLARTSSRAWLIAITPKGTEALAEWKGQLATALGHLFDDLDDDEWRVLDHAAQLLSTRVASEAVSA